MGQRCQVTGNANMETGKAKRGSGWQASRFRATTLAQTGGRCAACGNTDGVEAHHLGATDAEGGVALCRRCHGKATKAERLDPRR